MTSELDWKIRKEFPPIRPEIQPPTEWGPLNVPPLDPDGNLQTVPSNVPPAESVTVHTHDGTGTNSTIVGGVAEEGSAVPAASGAQAVAVGDFAQATADNTVAIGSGTSATRSAIASATRAIAIGSGDATHDGATASAADAIAIGSSDGTNACQATTAESIAIGVGARATTNVLNIAIGSAALANGGQGSIAIGRTAINGTTGAGAQLAIGQSASSNDAGTAVGPAASATAAFAGAFAYGALANAARATALGFQASATGADSLAVGANSVADQATSVALGQSANTTKANQLMLGTATEVVTHPGGVEYRVQTKTDTDYTLTAQDYYVRFSTGNTDRVATLPAVTTAIVGLVLQIKKIDAGTGIVTVTANSGGTPDLIDGAATFVLANRYDSVTLIAAAADVWEIL